MMCTTMYTICGKIEEFRNTHYKCFMKKKPHHDARKRTPF